MRKPLALRIGGSGAEAEAGSEAGGRIMPHPLAKQPAAKAFGNLVQGQVEAGHDEQGQRR